MPPSLGGPHPIPVPGNYDVLPDMAKGILQISLILQMARLSWIIRQAPYNHKCSYKMEEGG